MDLKKLKELDSPLVGRKVIFFRAGYTGEKTPSGDDVKKAVSEQLKVSPELVDIERIMQEFGCAMATVEVHVYKDAKSMEKFKLVHVKKAPKEEAKK